MALGQRFAIGDAAVTSASASDTEVEKVRLQLDVSGVTHGEAAHHAVGINSLLTKKRDNCLTSGVRPST